MIELSNTHSVNRSSHFILPFLIFSYISSVTGNLPSTNLITGLISLQNHYKYVFLFFKVKGILLRCKY